MAAGRNRMQGRHRCWSLTEKPTRKHCRSAAYLALSSREAASRLSADMANSRKKCAHKPCGKRQPADTMISNGVNSWCDDECRAAHAMAALAKLRAPKIKAEKQALQQSRAELKAFKQRDYSYQFGLTKSMAQGLANDLDRHLPCICCGTPRRGQLFCGGHYRTGKAHPELALDLLNIHGQANRNCNEGKSGNINGDKHSHGYRQGLIARYGQWIIDYLESYHPPNRRTCEQLIELRAEMAADRRRLKVGLPPLKDWRAPPKVCERPGGSGMDDCIQGTQWQ